MGNTNSRQKLSREKATTAMDTNKNPILQKGSDNSPTQEVKKQIDQLKKVQNKLQMIQKENINVIHSIASKQNAQNNVDTKAAPETSQNEIGKL